MRDDWTDLLFALLDAEVRFLVVGAHAMGVHGVPRATRDLDVWVEPSPENAKRVWRALGAFGVPLEALRLEQNDFADRSTVVQFGVPPVRVDVLTDISGVPDFTAAWVARSVHPVRGRAVPFLGREALIANKCASGRPKDLVDLDALGVPHGGA